MDKVPMTVRGYDALNEELNRLKAVDRRDVIQAIATARALGDLSENAEYHAAKDRQGFIEGRISELESKISIAEIIDPSQMTGSKVIFASYVTIVDEDTDEETTYQIVGVDEADVQKKRLSFQAPLARALIGKTVGDSIEVETPGGSKNYEILSVEYK